MNKPLTIARQEFAESLINIINGAELPAFVISGVLKETIAEVDKIAQNQLMADRQQWEKEAEEDGTD